MRDEDVGRNATKLPIMSEQMTLFKRNIPDPPQMGPIIGRSSYIDDIAHGALTWNQLCEDLNTLLFRLRYWNISVSLPKSEFGKLTIPYLSHKISAGGLRATPKIAKCVPDLPFPSTLKGVQSFLGSLNYYNKFVEDLPVIAAGLYELTDEQVRSGRDLARAKEAFEILKRKIVSTPLLRHSERTRQFVIIPRANPWAACAVLGQMYDEEIQPVRFTECVLNESEIRYRVAAKKVVAVLRVLEQFRPLICDSELPLLIYTRYSVLKWLLKSNSEEGRHLKWGLELSRWSLEVHRVRRDEDGLAAILGAGITPREHLDAVAEELIPAKGRIKPPPAISIEMLESDYEGVVLSFDGAAKTSTRQGSCGCVLWQLPGWHAIEARGYILSDVTVNDAKYHGLLKGLVMAVERGVKDMVVVGDSRIVIQQAQGLINCNTPNLQRRLAEYEWLKTQFQSVRLIHVKRLYNQAAYYLMSKTLALGESWCVEDEAERTYLELVSRIEEQVIKPVESASAVRPDVSNADAVPGPESAPGSGSPCSTASLACGSSCSTSSFTCGSPCSTASFSCESPCSIACFSCGSRCSTAILGSTCWSRRRCAVTRRVIALFVHRECHGVGVRAAKGCCWSTTGATQAPLRRQCREGGPYGSASRRSADAVTATASRRRSRRIRSSRSRGSRRPRRSRRRSRT
jgi:ribonuclease HI